MIAKGKFENLMSKMSPEAQQKARDGAAAQLTDMTVSGDAHSVAEPTWARTARLLRDKAVEHALIAERAREENCGHIAATEDGYVYGLRFAADIVEREGGGQAMATDAGLRERVQETLTITKALVMDANNCASDERATFSSRKYHDGRCAALTQIADMLRAALEGDE